MVKFYSIQLVVLAVLPSELELLELSRPKCKSFRDYQSEMAGTDAEAVVATIGLANTRRNDIWN